jgi:hypothetical protein
MDMTKNTEVERGVKPPKCGIYVCGVAISSQARAVKRKDGSGITVRVMHELALKPGVAQYEQWMEPGKDPGVKIEGDLVTEFPKFPELQPVTLRVNRYRVWDGTFIVSSGEVCP